MGNYRALPFAAYDLAVYLPGGAILLVLLQYFVSTVFGGQIVTSISLAGHDTVDDIVLGVVWLSASYLAGHLGAFFSSYAIERFIHKSLGYPSNVWLEMENSSEAGVSPNVFLRRIFTRNIKEYAGGLSETKRSLSSLLALVFLLPALPFFAIFYWAKPVGFYVPKLPERILPDVRRAFLKTRSSISIEIGTRWEKVVEHWVANNCPAAYQRMYNYLVIYGALRLLAFVMFFAAWIVILKSLLVLGADEGWAWSWRRFTIYGGSSFAGYMAMLAFAKFNRRYFEESVLALLLHNSAETQGRKLPSLGKLR